MGNQVLSRVVSEANQINWNYKIIGNHPAPRVAPERVFHSGDICFMIREIRWDEVVVKNLIVDLKSRSGENALWTSSPFSAEGEQWIFAIEAASFPEHHTYVWLVQLA